MEQIKHEKSRKHGTDIYCQTFRYLYDFFHRALPVIFFSSDSQMAQCNYEAMPLDKLNLLKFKGLLEETIVERVQV